MSHPETSSARNTGLLFRAARNASLLDPSTERGLLRRAQAGDADAVERIVVSHMRIVLSLAPSYKRAGVSTDDLVSEGVLGLLEAITRFDCTRENRFATYARWWIQARLRRFVGATRHVVLPPSTRVARKLMLRYGRTFHAETQRLGRTPTRVEIAHALDVEVEDVAAIEPVLTSFSASLSERSDGTAIELVSEDASPEDHVADEERSARVRERVAEGLSALTDRERMVLMRRLSQDEPESLAELGRELSVSRERVRQVQQRACEKFRARVRVADAL
jgi:RNA polymerase sigma-32 factor